MLQFKKWISGLTAGVVLLSGMAFSGIGGIIASPLAETTEIVASAATTTNGTCGDNLTWTLEDGVLTISGTGEMEDYSYGDAPWYTDQENITSIVIKDGVASIGREAFEYCTSLTSITIPDSVTSIGDDAFCLCESLTSITIPDSVTSIGNLTFSGCSSLTGITIPDSVTSIGNHAFEWCNSLTSITIPDSMTSIGEGAFYYCTSLTSITIPDSVTSIGDNAFSHCTNLTSITIPDSVTSIGDNVFSHCTNLTSITIPDSVTSIGNEAFYYCTSLTNIAVDENNEYYSSIDGVLFNKNQTELICYPGGKKGEYTIPGNVTSIEAYAFYSTDLTGITIPNSVTSIGAYAFYSTDLTSVTIPRSVTSIDRDAFGECHSLAEITILNPDCTLNNFSFYNYERGEVIDDWSACAWLEFSGTIYGYDNSTAQSYAKGFESYGCTFVSLGEAPLLSTADLDGDDAITISDAFLCLTAYANSAAGNDSGLTAEQEAVADVDGDGSITIMDASYILQFYAQTAAGNSPTWASILGN